MCVYKNHALSTFAALRRDREHLHILFLYFLFTCLLFCYFVDEFQEFSFNNLINKFTLLSNVIHSCSNSTHLYLYRSNILHFHLYLHRKHFTSIFKMHMSTFTWNKLSSLWPQVWFSNFTIPKPHLTSYSSTQPYFHVSWPTVIVISFTLHTVSLITYSPFSRFSLYWLTLYVDYCTHLLSAGYHSWWNCPLDVR